MQNSGCLVVPWGRIQPLRAGLEQAVKRKDEGGVGVAEKFWVWCEKETKEFV